MREQVRPDQSATEGERESKGGRPDGALSEPVILVLGVATVVRVEDQRASDICRKRRASESGEW